MNVKALKERLRMIKENQVQVEDKEIHNLTFEMLPHLGSTDPELRDELIYSLLSQWIIHNRVGKNRMKEIVKQCLDEEYLLWKVGEIETDSVFMRSFSTLIITSILYYHNRVIPFLDKEEIVKMRDIIFNYVNMEKDFRGYVSEKGWAHSIAHIADCLDELAVCPQIEQDDLKQLLCYVRNLIGTRDIAFIYGEDERMVTAIVSIINRKLLEKDTVLRWLHEFSKFDKYKVLPNDYWYAKNIKNLFRSLYFRTFNDAELSWLNEASLQGLKEISLQIREY